MRRLTLFFLFLFIPTLLIVGCSETENNITETTSETRQPQIDPAKVVVIPDENLANSIREVLELPEDVNITAGQLATLERLYCTSDSITDWTGLEYATQLEWLGLRTCLRSKNPRTGEYESIWDWNKETADLTPLVGLKNLHLDLTGNLIKDLTPLKVLKNLKKLDLSENHIEDLTPLAGLKQLTRLVIGGWAGSNRNIKDITPLAGLKQLTELWIDGTFDDLTPLAGLKQLTWLYIHGNVDDLTPLAGLKQLTTLGLEGNEISDVTPLTGLINLETLRLRGNPIVDKTPLEELQKKNPNVEIILD